MNSKKIALLIAVLAAIGLITGFAIWYVTSKAEEATVSSNPNTGDNENSTVSNTNSNQEEEDTNSNQEEEINMWFAPKKESKHFELFARIFRSKLKNELESLFKDQPYKNIRKDLEPLLYAINYDLLVANVEFLSVNTEPNKVTKSTQILFESNFKTYDIQGATEEEAEKMLKAVLDDHGIRKKLITSQDDIQKLKNISLSNFTLEALPNVFGVFKSLESIVIITTGVENIEALDEAIGLSSIHASHNNIEKIPKFDKLTKLGHLVLSRNPIKDIPADFVREHRNLQASSVILSPPCDGFIFSDEIKDIVRNSNGKIVIDYR